MDLYELDSKISFGLPPKEKDVCENIPKYMWINKLNDTDILRINLESNVVSIQAKCLYNHVTKESYINIINFRLEKI
jgi:hypothetical protein